MIFTTVLNPAALSSLSVNPSTVTGGTGVTGTVTLDGLAPAGGALVSLSSDNAAATVPASVTVEAGNSSVTFAVTTAVSASATATITASYAGITRTAALTVVPLSLSSLSVNPSSVTGGANATGTVTLNGPAPTGGVEVSLSSNNPAATVPGYITVTEGNTTATFSVTTSAVSASTTFTLSASYGGAPQTTLFTVLPAGALTLLSVDPVSVIGGASATGTITLGGPAPAGGAVVSLSSDNPAAEVPSPVTVVEGNASATFTVTTSAVSTPTAVTITASYDGQIQTASLSVMPPEGERTQFQITIDPSAHQTYGLYYPVTYVFQIPGGLSNLSGQYRYSGAGAWDTLATMSATDHFSGVAAARFDYDAGRAYLSVPFSAGSDSIYLRVLQGGSELVMSYLGVSAYYDNRRAAVSISLDDWNFGNGGYFNTALGILANAHVPATVGIETYALPDWSLIRNWYDAGNVEPASHSRDHPCSAGEYSATSFGYSSGYEYQIMGSRDDIKSHLSLRNPYVTTFIEPCGYTDAQVRQNVVNAGYLVGRGYPATTAQNTFSPWGGDGAYARTLYSIDTAAWYEHTKPMSSLLRETNASFDTAYGTGGVYHLQDHPWYGFWYAGSDLNQHITHISNRTDVWYAALGELYLYHFVTERGLMNAYAVGSTTPLPTAIITNPPPPPPPHTITEWPGNKKGAVSITFDDAMPSQVTLAVPALDAVGLKGTFFLVPTQADYDQTWSGWRAAEAEGHEMGSHSMTHANLTQISSSALQSELQASQAAIDAQIPNQKCLSLAYPFGAYNDTVVSATMQYYMAARITGWEGYDGLNYKPYDFYRLKAIGDDYNHTAGYAETATDMAEATGAWLVFYLHSMDGNGYGSWGINTLQNYLSYLVTKNLWVGTFGSTVKFVKERDSATLSIISTSSSEIVLSLTDTLDDSTYGQPLTIRSEVPSNWSQVNVSQGGNSKSVASSVENGKTVVYYEATPDRGIIILTSSLPAALNSLSLNPAAVTGGSSSTGTIALGEPAPPEGAMVSLSNSNAAVANVPASVAVAAGDTSATFTVTTFPVSASTALTITASYSGVTKTAALTVIPIALGSLSRNPSSVIGGTNSTGTVTLNGPAAELGSTVTLSSNNAAAIVPASVGVEAGQTSATFPVTTSPISASTAVTITSTFGGVTRTAILTVTPPGPSSLIVVPASVTGGTSLMGTVTDSVGLRLQGVPQ